MPSILIYRVGCAPAAQGNRIGRVARRARHLPRHHGFSFSCVLATVLALLFLPSAHAHPFHTSYAEADYRPASGKLEIALRLFADDAEIALSQRAGRKVSLARTPAIEFDALLFAYVRATLLVKSSDGSAPPLTWVGRELTDAGQHLWVYFECALPGGPARARFTSRVLRETFSDQINSIRVRDHSATPAREVTLMFMKESEQRVTFDK